MDSETNPTPTILLIERHDDAKRGIATALEQAHHRVVVATTAAAGTAALDTALPDLVLVDVQLPDRSGIDVCRAIRAHTSIPIVLIAGDNSEIDIIVGLEVGADAVITDPTRLRELVARVRVMLRPALPPRSSTPTDARSARSARSTGAQLTGTRSTSNGAAIRLVRDGQVVTVGDVSLDRVRHELTVRGQVVALPLKQFQLLDLLMQNAGHVVPRDRLIREIWGIDYYGDTKTLDAHATRLRGAIEVDPRHPTRVLTVRGVGYRFDPVEATPVPRTETAHLELVSA